MEYVSVVGSDFEDAVRKAKKTYGENIKIYSKQTVRRGLLNRKCVEISFCCPSSEKERIAIKIENEKVLKNFENEAQTPPPEVSSKLKPSNDEKVYLGLEDAPQRQEKKHAIASINQSQNAPNDQQGAKIDGQVEMLEALLKQNDFTPSFSLEILEKIKAELDKHSYLPLKRIHLEEMLINKILQTVSTDQDSQINLPRIFVMLGPTGAGKTTTIAKIAALYHVLPSKGTRRDTAIITIDSYKIGAGEQIFSFAKDLGVEAVKATNETEFESALSKFRKKELILVDTFGASPLDRKLEEKLKAMLSVPDSSEIATYITISANMKSDDILRSIDHFKEFNPKSFIVTKIDETETIGNIVSISWQTKLPLFFITNGQKVPQDIHKASSALILSKLKGFSMDFSSLWET